MNQVKHPSVKSQISVVEHYVERGETEKNLLNCINEYSHVSKCIFAYGPRGIGKTFLLNYLEENLGANTVVLRFNIDRFNVDDPEYLQNIVLEFLKQNGLASSPTDQKTDTKGLRNTLRGLLKSSRLRIRGERSSIDLSIGDDLIQKVSYLRDTFQEKASNLSSEDSRYPNQLADIVSDAIGRLEDADAFVLLVDGLEYADAQILYFIARILESRISTLVAWTTSRYSDIESEKVRSFIQTMSTPSFARSNYDMPCGTLEDLQPMRSFNISEIEEFLSRNGLHTDLSASQIEQLTSGIPRFIELAARCHGQWADKYHPVQNTWVAAYCDAMLTTNHEKTAIGYIAVNGGRIQRDLVHKVSNDTDDGFLLGIDSLLHKGFISIEDDCYQISVPMVQSHLEQEYSSGAMAEKRARDLLIAERTLSPKRVSEHYRTLVSASLASSQFDLAISYAIEGSITLKNGLKQEAAAKLLLPVLERYMDDQSPFSYCKKYELSMFFIECEIVFYDCGMVEKSLEAFHCLKGAGNFTLIQDRMDEAYLYAGKAFYYLNDKDRALKNSTEAMKSSNSSIRLDAQILYLATLDLAGDYAILCEEYRRLLHAADDEEKACLEMICQMVATKFEECRGALQHALSTFKKFEKLRYEDGRRYACCKNNLGIEYLMAGEPDSALPLLEEALGRFERDYPAEVHFPLNNLALYYALHRGDNEYASALLDRAFKHAISPLQKGYVLMNRAMIKFLEGDYDGCETEMSLAQQHIDETPDPVAKGYFAYNAALLRSRMSPNCATITESEIDQIYLGVSKSQNYQLLTKRERLISSANSSSPERAIAPSDSDRRTFFSEVEWEPCELMFYS